MADQAKVNQRNGSPSEPSGSLSSDVGGFAHDVLTLAELQSQLFLAEVREFGLRSVWPSFVLMSGVMLGAACFPIALVAVAFGLVQYAHLSIANAFLIALVLGLLCSLLLSIIGCLQMRKRMCFLQRSRIEFQHNYEWIKSAFNSSRIAKRTATNTPKEQKR